MNNIFKLITIVVLACTVNMSQATQLEQVQEINPAELVKMSKLHLAEAIKLNTIALNPIESNARAQIAMNISSANIDEEAINKTLTLAD